MDTGTNDTKNTHIDFEWELETLAVVQRRMAQKQKPPPG